jgi:hypothetical protein
MKKFILGFVIGAMLFSIMPIKAAIEEFKLYKSDSKVIIKGSEFKHETLPFLTYQGNDYAPLKPMLESAGFVVNWNTEQKEYEAIVPTPTPEPTPTPSPTPTPIPVLNVGETWDGGDIDITLKECTVKPSILMGKIYYYYANVTVEIHAPAMTVCDFHLMSNGKNSMNSVRTDERTEYKLNFIVPDKEGIVTDFLYKNREKGITVKWKF